jgi:GNAT superfamily N-acetyltransferase
MGLESKIKKRLESVLALPEPPRFVKVAKIGERHEYSIVYRTLKHTIEGFPANDFSIEAYALINKKPVCMGEYLAHEDSDHSYEKDISDFLDLKQIIPESPLPKLYWSSVKVKKEMQGKGLGGILLNELVEEFQRIRAIHIASFTEDGLKCIKKKFLDKDYQFLRIIKEVPEKYRDVSGWMFKDYRQEKK